MLSCSLALSLAAHVASHSDTRGLRVLSGETLPVVVVALFYLAVVVTDFMINFLSDYKALGKAVSMGTTFVSWLAFVGTMDWRGL